MRIAGFARAGALIATLAAGAAAHAQVATTTPGVPATGAADSLMLVVLGIAAALMVVGTGYLVRHRDDLGSPIA